MSRQTRILFLALLASLSLPAFAGAEESVRDRADLDRAAELRRQSGEEREKIEADRARGEAECRTKVLENRCLDGLKDSLVRREKAVRAHENEAGRLERAVKARGVAARDAAREADRPLRDAQQAEQARQFRIEQERKQAEAPSPRPEAAGEEGGPARAARAGAKLRQRQREAEEAASRARRARADQARYDEKQKQHDERQKKAAAKAAAKAATEAVSKAAASVPRH